MRREGPSQRSAAHSSHGGGAPIALQASPHRMLARYSGSSMGCHRLGITGRGDLPALAAEGEWGVFVDDAARPDLESDDQCMWRDEVAHEARCGSRRWPCQHSLGHAMGYRPVRLLEYASSSHAGVAILGAAAWRHGKQGGVVVDPVEKQK